MADPVPPYSATVDGVRAHIPLTSITTETHPSVANVEHYLAQLSGTVRARIGDLAGHPLEAVLTEAARGVVEVGAASMAEAAGFPERADRADTSYAGLLWDRHRQMLDDLVAAVLGDIDGDGDPDAGGGGLLAGTPASHFPEPLYIRDIGF